MVGGPTLSLLKVEVKGVRAPVEGKIWVERKRVYSVQHRRIQHRAPTVHDYLATHRCKVMLGATPRTS